MNAARASRSAGGMVRPSFERRHRISSGKRAHSFAIEVAHLGARQFRPERRTRSARALASRARPQAASHRPRPGAALRFRRGNPSARARRRPRLRTAATRNRRRAAAGRGPARRHRIERVSRETRALRPQPRGRDIAAEQGQQRRLAAPRVEQRGAVARSAPAGGVEGKLDAGNRADHVGGVDPLAKVAVGGVAEISDVGGGHRHRGGVALEGVPDGTDQREIALIGAGENQLRSMFWNT